MTRAVHISAAAGMDPPANEGVVSPFVPDVGSTSSYADSDDDERMKMMTKHFSSLFVENAFFFVA